MAPSHKQLFDSLARFRAAWPRRGWSYDSRVQCVASSFSAEQADSARALVATILPHVWTSRTLVSAPPAFAQIAERTGGVRSSQQLFGGDPVSGLLPFGLWWPWEEGSTISLRIGLEGSSMAETLTLCETFGAEPLGRRSAAGSEGRVHDRWGARAPLHQREGAGGPPFGGLTPRHDAAKRKEPHQFAKGRVRWRSPPPVRDAKRCVPPCKGAALGWPAA